MKQVETIFTDIMKQNKWGSDESVSGTGSTWLKTLFIRRALPSIFEMLEIKSLLDAPCGDMNWMKRMLCDTRINSSFKYQGIDVVGELINSLDELPTDLLDLTVDKGDILDSRCRHLKTPWDAILCRDALVHFPFKDIERAIRNFKNSGSSYLIATTFPGVLNRDIKMGDWRRIDLTRRPFNLGPPLLLINEDTGMYKCLGVWRLSDIEI